MNPLVILSGGKDALLARETFVTDLYIYIYIYFFFFFSLSSHSCNKSPRSILMYHNS